MTFDEARQRLDPSEVRRIKKEILQSVLDDKEGVEWIPAGSVPVPEKEEGKTAE
jgi:hypothetical protein